MKLDPCSPARQKKQVDNLSWELCYTTGELVEAAFITASSTLGVFLMICATQLDATRKVPDRLQRVIEFARLLVFEDLSGLSYFCAYAKGVFAGAPLHRWMVCAL